jgi:ubiquinone/menaquinone biosynthesis C-methylase UbiE
MATPAEQKSIAVQIHEDQAQLFKGRYETAAQDPYSSAFTYGRKKVDDILDHYLPDQGESARLLDAGCGSGHTLRKYAARGYACHGLDAAASMVALARELNPQLSIVEGDVEALPYESRSFDYLLSVEVLRYLAEPQLCLREFHRVLKPGGVALVTAMPPWSLTGYPLANMLTSRVQIGRFSKVRQFFHTVARLERLMRAAGFTHVEVRAAFWGPFRTLEVVAPRLVPHLLRWWEPVDDALSHFAACRNFSNHLVAVGRR